MSTTLADLPRMDADEFLAWELQRTEDDDRYELHDGRVRRMPNEGALRGEVKALLTAAFVFAVRRAGLEAQVFTGEMNVLVADGRMFKPDVMLRVGPRLPPQARVVRDPVVVVEIVSPSSERRDKKLKLEAYFELPTIKHYLIVNPDQRRITHHRRTDATKFEPRTCGDEPLTLDPPGITIDRFFP